MNLSGLPVEVLAQILDGDSSWNALTLWQTGDAQMRHNLSHGGITHMDLRFPVIERSATWPTCLKEFRLRSLSISSPRPLMMLRELRAELLQLQPGLKTLSLKVPGGVEVFTDGAKSFVAIEAFDLDAPGDYEDTYGNDYDEGEPVERPSAPRGFHLVEELRAENLSDLWDPHAAFHSLESLTLAHTSSTDRTIAFEAGTLSFVPKSVKSLELSVPSKFRINWSTLPQELVSLQGLRIDYPDNAPEVLQALPKTLTHLSASQDWKLYLDVLSAELPNLTNVHAHWRLAEDDTFPSFAKTYVVLEVPLSYRSRPLPSGIEYLIPRCAIELDFLHILPASLTSINITELVLNAKILSLPPWPPLLTEMHLASSIGPEHFHILPRTLKTLVIGSTRAAAVLAKISENDLLRLGSACITGVDAHPWRQAREELIAYGKTRRGIDSGFVSAYIAHVESGGLWGLPLGLTEFYVQSKLLEYNAKMILPPRIRAFTASADTKVFNNLLFFDLLPPYLTELSIEGDPRNFELLKQPNPSSHFYNMPYLRHIAIGQAKTSSPHLYLALFPRLPRGLLSLHMRCALPKFDSSALRELPPNLTELLLNPEGGVTPYRAWLHVLPRTLETLHLSRFRSAMHASDLINLPPRLKELSGPMARLNVDALFTIPRSIRRFNVDGSPMDEDGTPLVGDRRDGSNLETLNILATDDWFLLRSTLARPFNRIFDNRPQVEALFENCC